MAKCESRVFPQLSVALAKIRALLPPGMNGRQDGTFRVGRLFGIDIHIDPWVLLLFAYLVMGRRYGPIWDPIGFGGILVLSVLLHEFGHALAARKCGIGTRCISLGMLGGVAVLESKPMTNRQDLFVTVMGPMVNVALWAAAGARFLAGENFAYNTQAGGWIARVGDINLGLLCFNLIPAFPLDGGRILKSLLAMKMSPWKAMFVTCHVAWVAAGGMVLWGLWDWRQGARFPIFRVLIAWQIFATATSILQRLREARNAPGA